VSLECWLRGVDAESEENWRQDQVSVHFDANNQRRRESDSATNGTAGVAVAKLRASDVSLGYSMRPECVPDKVMRYAVERLLQVDKRHANGLCFRVASFQQPE
jgi:hypothetical protein